MTPTGQRSAQQPRDRKKSRGEKESLIDLQRRVLETELETMKKFDQVLDQAANFSRMAAFHVVSGGAQHGRPGAGDQWY